MRMETSEARYVLEAGVVRYRVETVDGDGKVQVEKDLEICPEDGELALAYDEIGAVLHSHGERSRVEEWHDRTSRALSNGGYPHLAKALVVVTFPPTPETLDELNACIATAGRVARFAERLASHPHRMPRR